MQPKEGQKPLHRVRLVQTKTDFDSNHVQFLRKTSVAIGRPRRRKHHGEIRVHGEADGDFPTRHVLGDVIGATLTRPISSAGIAKGITREKKVDSIYVTPATRNAPRKYLKT